MKPFLFVFCFLIFHATLSHTQEASGLPDWGCLSGYHHYRAINITASDAVEDGEYLLTLDTAAEVSAGRLQSSGYDMIFTDSNGCVKYCFFIELTTMNTQSTQVWVKIPGQITPPLTLLWVYGADARNSKAKTPDSTQSGYCAFSFFSDFSSPSASAATSKCGTVSVTTNDTMTTLDWDQSGGFNANVNFTTTNVVWVFEAYVTAAKGEYPGVFAYNYNISEGGYGLVSTDSNALYIGWVWPLGIDKSTCSTGWDWDSKANLSSPQSFPAVWSFTWLNETYQIAERRRPDGTLLHSNASQYSDWPMSKDLTFFVGGIDSGTGGMSLSWMRARKYNPNVAYVGPGTLQNVVSSSADTLHSFLINLVQLLQLSMSVFIR